MNLKPEYQTRQDILSALRSERGGDTLEVFAHKVGISISGLCNILHGQRKPGPRVLAFLSRQDPGAELQPVEAYQRVPRAK
jgi:hypothetical protein